MAPKNETATAGTGAVQGNARSNCDESFDSPAGGNGQDLCAAALAYAGAGWRVFPCAVDKHPLVKAWPDVATADPVRIGAWWTRWPGASIGLVTGRTSGVWALDVDLPDGPATLAALEAQHNPLPPTVEQRTGSGGRHLFFMVPNDGREVRSTTKRLGPGLHTRGERGYVVMPPSGHPSGGRYGWVNVPGDVPLAKAPGWLLELVARRPEAKPADIRTPVADLDTDGNVLAALEYLQDYAPPAIEGHPPRSSPRSSAGGFFWPCPRGVVRLACRVVRVLCALLCALTVQYY